MPETKDARLDELVVRGTVDNLVSLVFEVCKVWADSERDFSDLRNVSLAQSQAIKSRHLIWIYKYMKCE